MIQNPPYQSPLLDMVLHFELQDIEGVHYCESDAALKSVALVGMLLPENQRVKDKFVLPEDIYSEDRTMFRKTFSALSRAKIPIDPYAKFHVYNILPPVQSDFLLAATDYEDIDFPKNDLSILMYLPKYGTTPRDRFYMGNKGFRSYDSKELNGDQSWRLFTAASHLHHSFHIWADAADRLGSKLVVTFGGIDDEITTQHFEGHSAFRTLIDSEDNQRKKELRSRSNMGVVVRAEAIKELTDTTEPNSEIGAALRHPL